ncbi:MAG: outer membrane protein assembly factor BamA, partial [Verrucomicrobia bacterium]
MQLGFTVYTRKFNFDQARQAEIFSGQRLNLPSPFLQNLQNYTQASTGFSLSLSYPLHRSFKRVGLTYAYDRSSVIAVSDASKILFTNLAFRGISGPNSLSGIVTSKILPSFSFNTVDSPYFPKTGTSLYLGGEISGLGGTV